MALSHSRELVSDQGFCSRRRGDISSRLRNEKEENPALGKKAKLSNSPASDGRALSGGRAGSSSGASSAQELLYIPFASETFVQVFHRVPGVGHCCRQAWPQSYRNNPGSSLPHERMEEVKAIIHLRELIQQLLPLPGPQELNPAAVTHSGQFGLALGFVTHFCKVWPSYV